MSILTVIFLVVVLVIFIFGIRIIRPTHRGLVETLGKYNRVCDPGFNWIIPLIESMKYRNITERIADVDPQDIITKDNLNATVDLQVYYKVKNTAEDIKASYYNVEDFKDQIISLSQTTVRNVIGDMNFVDVNNQRSELNSKIQNSISDQIKNWGVEIVRVELKEISPPEDVQATMNRIIKASNEKIAAIDSATAVETQADGLKRSAIKEAEGKAQAAILEAEAHKKAQILNAEALKEAKILVATGEAESIKLVNEAAEKYFTDKAQILRKIEAVEETFKQSTKVILPSNQSMLGAIGELIKA